MKRCEICKKPITPLEPFIGVGGVKFYHPDCVRKEQEKNPPPQLKER